MPKIVTSIILSIVLLYGCINAVDSTTSSSISNKIEVQACANQPEQIVLYALDGRELEISIEEKEIYLNLGWYEKPVQIIYDCNNNEKIVFCKEVEYLINSGNYFLEKRILVNKEDQILLAKVIYAEATENPNLRIQDRQYVGAVIMNRLNSGYYGSTLRDVIYAPRQYACIYSQKFKSNPPQECLDIAYQLLSGETFGVPSNVFFQAQFPQGKGTWKKVGVHYYCYR